VVLEGVLVDLWVEVMGEIHLMAGLVFQRLPCERGRQLLSLYLNVNVNVDAHEKCEQKEQKERGKLPFLLVQAAQQERGKPPQALCRQMCREARGKLLG